ncbi:hypothetical protein [Streptomyces sp. enrichment culture]|uniref:hypothetical protein n=1 Tax=Streptomyces sp. enrichment culture TaxID=1795815 RepID=UPI003F55FD49
MPQHPDYKPGDQIDLYDPPEHCGQPMVVWNSRTSAAAHEVVCREYDADFRTDYDGNVIS